MPKTYPPYRSPLMQYFEYSHLPPHLQQVSKRFAELAESIDTTQSAMLELYRGRVADELCARDGQPHRQQAAQSPHRPQHGYLPVKWPPIPKKPAIPKDATGARLEWSREHGLDLSWVRMPPVTVVDFCCGMTQRGDTDRAFCRKCGRDFNAKRLTPELLAPIAPPAGLERLAFSRGLFLGFLAGVAIAVALLELAPRFR